MVTLEPGLVSDSNASRVYWAAEEKSEDLASRALKKRSEYIQGIQRTGRLERMRRSWRAYYGYSPDGQSDSSALTRAGDNQEIVKITPNHFATLLRQVYVRQTKNRPGLKAVATNTDYADRAQAELAQSVIEYYDRKLSVSAIEANACFTALLLSDSWILQSWNAGAGKTVGVDLNQKPIYSGEIELRVISPVNIAYDLDCDSEERLTWILARYEVSKFDLAALYPKAAPEILKQQLRTTETDVSWQRGMGLVRNMDEAERVWVYELRHLRTPAVPNGRHALWCSPTCILFDSAKTPPPGNVYPLKGLHAFQVVPERTPGTLAGHTPAFDLLSLQETLDMTASIATSAVNAGGLMNLWVPLGGAEPTLQQLTTGLNVIRSAQKPEAIDSVKLSPEVVALGNAAREWMRERLSINQLAASGTPSANMPGNLAALMEAQTDEFFSELEANFHNLIERNRTGIIQMLQTFATTGRVAEIAGKNNAYELREWNREDIAGVERMAIEKTGSSMRSLSGRMQVADQLLKVGAVNAEQYLALYTTGKLQALYEGKHANELRITSEKEMLRQGIGIPPLDLLASQQAGAPVFVDDGQPHITPLISDTHWLDIQSALEVLNTPGARDNARVVKACTDFINCHMDLWAAQPPAMTMLLGGPPFLPPGMPPGGAPPADESGPDAPQQNRGEPSLPRPPANPITGEKSDPLPMEQ